MRVLVTGGAGYLGSILCEHLLAAGHRVVVLDALHHGVPSLLHLCGNPDFEFVRGDARDEAVLRNLIAGADAIIPLAAVVGAPACDRDPWLARSTNLEAIQTPAPACAARHSSWSTRRPTAATARSRATCTAPRRRRSSRSRSTAAPRSRRRRRCSTRRTRSRCASRRCSGHRRGCGSTCSSTTSSTPP